MQQPSSVRDLREAHMNKSSELDSRGRPMGVDVIASVTMQLVSARDLKRLPMPWGSMMLLLLLLLMLLAPILRVSKHS